MIDRGAGLAVRAPPRLLAELAEVRCCRLIDPFIKAVESDLLRMMK